MSEVCVQVLAMCCARARRLYSSELVSEVCVRVADVWVQVCVLVRAGVTQNGEQDAGAA